MTKTTDELPRLPKGRIAPASSLRTQDQLRLYQEAMGRDATLRQARLVREELARQKAAPKAPGRR